MKIAVFLDGFKPFHEHKEGQLIMGFIDLGVPSVVVTPPNAELHAYDSPFPLLKATRSDLADARLWNAMGIDAAVLFTWFSPDYLDILAAVKKGGALLLIRPDTDGRIGPPAPVRRRTFYIRPPRIRQIPRWIGGRLLWHMYFGRRAADGLLRTLILSDAVVLESPNAVANVARILVSYKRPDLIDRLCMIPNQVCPHIVCGPIGPKEKVVAAVGRWEDYRQKNTIVMVRVLIDFLTQRSDYRAVLAGSGATLLNNLLLESSDSPHDRISVTGGIPHDAVGRILATSQILFMPSLFESFGYAAAEALCAGCSVVGTPIEPLQYLSMGGLTGTLASDFGRKGLLAALLADAKKWDRGEYVPNEVARRWRALLDRRVVAQQYLDKFSELTANKRSGRP
jgi:glycosyltransferase involved in cell wall biosynthesis